MQPQAAAGRLAPVDTGEQAPPLTDSDVNKPSAARVYDYWLGGKNNFPADRVVGARAATAMPTLVPAIYANRAFLGRVVRHAVNELGITQFLDLGSGVPTVGNVHEIAQDADPDCRIVYVDIDPVAVAHGQRLLADNPRASVIKADLRDAPSVLHHPQTDMLLDLGKPVAVLMIAVLHFIPDSEDPAGIVRAYRDAIVPGSYLALSHAAPDPTYPAEQADMESGYNSAVDVEFTHRTPGALEPWLTGFTVVYPGIVQVNDWLPDRAERQEILPTYGLLARREP